MLQKIGEALWSKELPTWFRLLNLVILAPIIIWPIVAFISIFALDNPTDLFQTFALIFMVDAYPLYLLLLVYLNIKIAKYNKFLGLIIPIIIIVGILWAIKDGVMSMIEYDKAAAMEEKTAVERKKQGFVNSDDTYKVLEGKLYYKNSFVSVVNEASLIPLDSNFIKDSNKVYYKGKEFLNADAETFINLYHNWQKDKAHIYKNGQIVADADVLTFNALNEYYAKDKTNVFFKAETMKEANKATFEIIKGTQDAKDIKNCYSLGKIIDCKLVVSPHRKTE